MIESVPSSPTYPLLLSIIPPSLSAYSYTSPQAPPLTPSPSPLTSYESPTPFYLPLSLLLFHPIFPHPLSPSPLTPFTPCSHWIGCQRSTFATEVYAKRATVNKAIVRAGFGYVIIANAFAHGFPALCPFMYWLFGAPTPDKWYQPVQVNEA